MFGCVKNRDYLYRLQEAEYFSLLLSIYLISFPLDSSPYYVRYAPAIIRSGCSIVIDYFPFDEQKCHLEFGSWTHNGFELDLYYAKDHADTSFYLPSSEFDLISAKASRVVNKFE